MTTKKIKAAYSGKTARNKVAAAENKALGIKPKAKVKVKPKAKKKSVRKAVKNSFWGN